jgi:aspartate racemase
MPPPTIGILAGMGPRSTAPFIDLVVTECQTQYGARDDIDFPKLLILSQPAPFYEDRPTDHAALEAAIRDGLQHLQRAGADFLAIACNTAHIYYSQLAAAVNIPLLNMVDVGVTAVPPSARRVALLAARPTVEAGIYQTALERRGLTVVDPGWQADIDHLLGATRTTTDATILGRQFNDLLARAETLGADTVLVACLDLSAVAAHTAPAARVVNTARCLACEIVREWLRRRSAREGNL